MTAATETRLPPQVRKQGQAAKDAIADVQKQREGSQQTPPVDTPPAQPEGVTQTPPPEQPAPPKIEPNVSDPLFWYATTCPAAASLIAMPMTVASSAVPSLCALYALPSDVFL